MQEMSTYLKFPNILKNGQAKGSTGEKMARALNVNIYQRYFCYDTVVNFPTTLPHNVPSFSKRRFSIVCTETSQYSLKD